MDTAVTDPLLGRLLDGRYRVRDLVARGGMGCVYTALDTRLDRLVAVKVMHPWLAEDRDFVARFRREATAAARLSSPHAVAVTDQGADAGSVFLVMEYVAGRTLRRVLQERGPLRPAEALDLAEPVLSALAAAHAAGIVHRDVKPENVLLGDDGSVKVADFGLARAVEASPVTSVAGVLLGTVGYVSPEQVVSGRGDERSDVYSAGVLLFEMLTGTLPHGGDTAMAVAYAHVNTDVPPPSARIRGVPPALDQVVLRATARDPSRRTPDARAMLDQVRRVRRSLGPGAGQRDLMTLPLDERSTQAVPGPARPPSPARTPQAGPVIRPVPGAQPWAGPASTAAADGAVRAARHVPGDPPRRRRVRPLTVAVLVFLVVASVLAGLAGWWFAHGRYVTVPGLAGRSAAAATAAVGGHHLRLVHAPDTYSDAVAAGLVAVQSPGPGSRVVRGGRVTVRLSLGPELFTVPSVRGRSEADARQALQLAHLVAGPGSQVYNASAPVGQVLSSTPPAGRRLRTGATVSLVVSRGHAPVDVPAGLVGQDPAAVARTLTALGLRVRTGPAVYSDTAPQGTVATVAPAGGAQPFHSTVTVATSLGPPIIAVPTLPGSLSGDEQALRAVGLVPDVVSFPGHAIVGDVVAVDPQPRSPVRKGSSVTLYVF